MIAIELCLQRLVGGAQGSISSPASIGMRRSFVTSTRSTRPNSAGSMEGALSPHA